MAPNDEVIGSKVKSFSYEYDFGDGWQVLSFLETPCDSLDGLAPRIALEQGMPEQRIVDLATADGH
jgi:hypothetical protein